MFSIRVVEHPKPANEWQVLGEGNDYDLIQRFARCLRQQGKKVTISGWSDNDPLMAKFFPPDTY